MLGARGSPIAAPAAQRRAAGAAPRAQKRQRQRKATEQLELIKSFFSILVSSASWTELNGVTQWLVP